MDNLERYKEKTRWLQIIQFILIVIFCIVYYGWYQAYTENLKLQKEIKELLNPAPKHRPIHGEDLYFEKSYSHS